MIDLIILILSVAICAPIGVFVVSRNPRHIVNRLYGLLTISLVMYPIFNYLSLQTDDRLFYIRATIFFTTIVVSSIYYLIWYLRAERRPLSRLQFFGIFASIFVAVADLTPIIFSELSEGSNPVPIFKIGSLLYLGHFVAFLTATVLQLTRLVKLSTGLKSQQYLYMLVGMTPMFALSPITGFILPILFQNANFVFLSPVYGTFFVGMVGYAIVKHRLFDIRLIAARSFAYLLSWTAITLTYLTILVVLASVLFDTNIDINLELFTYLFIGLTLASGLQPIKRYFDRFTNRLFYRDAYDPQALLDELNKELVTNVELESLLKACAKIITKNIKPDFALFALKETAYSGQRMIGTTGKEFRQEDIDAVRSITPHTKKTLIVTDDLEEDSDLKIRLRKYDIAIFARLATDLKSEKEGVGYLVLGPKKSGNPYNSQDIKIIEIVANELVIAIQNALRFEEIEQFNITLQEKVDDATKRLRRTNEKLRELDETKDEFISMASHQLRTPLTSVKGYISMVMEGDAGKISAAQRKLLDQAFVSSQRMVYLIADLLNVSRLKTGKFIIEPKETNLAELVEGEIGQLVETAAGRDLELKYDKPENFPELMLDETKIRQVVMNFIDNAIYYTPAGGHILVSVTETPEAVEFRVTDDGMGVPKHEQHHLFSKFYRAGNAKKARPDGTGLGLFMAKKVIVAQGGSVIFNSQEGKGSTFGFAFSKAKLTAPSTKEEKADERAAVTAA